MADYAKKVAVPGAHDINTGIEPAHHDEMVELFGPPGALTRECSSITNARIQKKVETASVGPIRVTMVAPAIQDLTAIFAKVKSEHPDLCEVVDSEGGLCCRAVRKSAKHWSNHSWGFAIDLRIGELDQYGATKCAAGLIELYHYFHVQGWYWGAGFPTKDPMHFEVGMAKIRSWVQKGLV